MGIKSVFGKLALGLASLGLLSAANAQAPVQNLEKKVEEKVEQTQLIEINVPAYRLELYDTTGGKKVKQMELKVGVGRGYSYDNKDKVPPFTAIGKGYVTGKFKAGKIRYSKGKRKGEIVTHNSGFDEDGNYRYEKIQYNKVMRSLPMAIYQNSDGKKRTAYIIHTTYDEFTVGFNASGGCIRTKRDEMLKLYNLVVPEKRTGRLKKDRVKLVTEYDLVELEKSNKQGEGPILVVHADIYRKHPDYIAEIKKDMIEQDIDPKEYDLEKLLYDRLEPEIARLDRQIGIIKRQYGKSSTRNFVSKEMKAKLHSYTDLASFRVTNQ